jgi:hypothetical protein
MAVVWLRNLLLLALRRGECDNNCGRGERVGTGVRERQARRSSEGKSRVEDNTNSAQDGTERASK